MLDDIIRAGLDESLQLIVRRLQRPGGFFRGPGHEGAILAKKWSGTEACIIICPSAMNPDRRGGISMRNLSAVIWAVFVAALILCVVSPAFAGAKTHQMKATVVAVDVEGSKITVKDETGAEKTAPVMDKAVETLKTLKAGDKVTLTCTDNEKGEHEGVTAI